jgi:hypothetical protein
MKVQQMSGLEGWFRLPGSPLTFPLQTPLGKTSDEATKSLYRTAPEATHPSDEQSDVATQKTYGREA